MTYSQIKQMIVDFFIKKVSTGEKNSICNF